MNTDEEKVILTAAEAKKLLPAKEQIHTFRQAPGWVPVLIGADWDREDVEAEIDKCGCEVAGKMAQSMGHGLVVHTREGPLFVETAKLEGEP